MTEVIYKIYLPLRDQFAIAFDQIDIAFAASDFAIVSAPSS